MNNKKISIVVSVYNEEQVLPMFYKEIMPIAKSLEWDYEIIFANDGSTDNSLKILNKFADENSKIKVISFSRNFGHEAAMIAGIDHATGDGIVCLDADLQHPPQLIPLIIEKFKIGYNIINMVRTKNEDVGFMKKITSNLFYKVLNTLSTVHFENNASDFFALSSQAAEVIRKDYRERARFLRGFVQDLGFEKTTIDYEARKRGAGESKYSLKGLLKFSINALLSFSDLPLKFGMYAGSFAGFLGVILMIYTIISKVVYDTPSGYATIICVMCFMFAILFFLVGIIGEYIAILFKEVKNRPIYIIGSTRNIEN